ncbi:methylmalonyl-CoA mutase family protein [Micromonospora sp. NPDC047707]|uniref:methylmalonyl-CoA mutase family protein n=1 Tax=Micromonospora sp. NPDC047707 TaxID=3154498 RepID=UPI0034532F28
MSGAAYAYAREVETGGPIVVGVHRFPARTEPLDVLRVNPALEEAQVPSLAALREHRDARAVAAIVDLTAAAQAGDNLMPECIDAIRADATVGEMVARLRNAHGPWTPSTSY